MYTLAEIWKTLCKQFTQDEEQIRDLYEELNNSYRESHRYYHTLEHIYSMIEEIQSVKDTSLDKTILLFAAYFHDVIYDPQRKDNESKSSEKAEQVLQLLHVPQNLIIRVQQLILATADHTKAGSDDQLDFFLDCDLKILGASTEVYKNYAENIRKEYKHVPSVLYNYGRKKILKRFITTPSIYRTSHFYMQYEKQARKNILNEIQQL